MANEKQAAVSYIEREDGLLLCVWNKRYGGWSFPGGLVEENETVEEGQRRELLEETSLITVTSEFLFSGQHKTKIATGRGSFVHVFKVTTEGTPREMETGCPVTWLSREEFLRWSPFAEFYSEMFQIKGLL